MSKSQKFEDMSKVRIVKYVYPAKDHTVEVVVLYKRGAQYHLCYVEGKTTFHMTEKQLTESIEKAKLLDSPLSKALE